MVLKLFLKDNSIYLVASPIKRLIKRAIGNNGYSILINTKLGSKIHDVLHSNSSTSRDFLLQLFPKFSTGIEIGVNDGDFSERIMEIVRPNKLHLVDPWKFSGDTVYSDAPYGSKNVAGQNMMDEKYNNVKMRFRDLINKNDEKVQTCWRLNSFGVMSIMQKYKDRDQARIMQMNQANAVLTGQLNQQIIAGQLASGAQAQAGATTRDILTSNPYAASVLNTGAVRGI